MGGRLELGGIVADFLFEHMKLVIRVQGPTHKEFLRYRKDEEQRLILEEMGYRVVDLDLDVIYSEHRLEETLRRLFGFASAVGSSFGAHDPVHPEDRKRDELDYSRIWELLKITEQLVLEVEQRAWATI
jgi:DNA polymerase elongation subunit (family B)